MYFYFFHESQLKLVITQVKKKKNERILFHHFNVKFWTFF